MISILKLDKETRLEIIKDLFNEVEHVKLVPYGGASSYRADLWQNIVSNRVIVKIEDNIEINDFELIHDAYERYESIINTEPPQHFILIVLRDVSQEIKNRLLERFGRSKAKNATIYGLDNLLNLLEKKPEIVEKYFGIMPTWHVVYSHIAEIMNKHFTKNADSPSQSFYQKIKNSKFLELNKDRIYQYDPNENPEGLDPVQVFACFNYTKINIKTRVETINALLEAIGSGRRVNHETDFSGVPAPIITQIKYNRKIEVQNEIWNFFSRVYIGKLNGLSQKDFSALNQWRGLQIPSLTMFLFWIDSENFLPLDTNTVKYLINLGILDYRPKKYKEYIDLCLKKNKLIKNLPSSGSREIFRNIVKEAYGFYEDKNSDISVSGTTQSIVYVETGKNEDLTEIKERVIKQRIEQFKGFKIIALRPHWKEKLTQDPVKQKHIKNLKEEEIYCFYKAFEFKSKEDTEIEYNQSLDIDLYNVDNVNISISAVVGMNGSGKSTIADFLYLITNRISIEKKIAKKNVLKNEEVFADLFIKSDKLYKIRVGAKVEAFIYELNEEGTKYIRKTENSDGTKTFKSFDIETLCYSLVVNYSLYGLNSNIIGDWINPLFHKNDAYQVPIVLNPKRNEGKVDVNSEDELAKTRLLMNLLEPSLNDLVKAEVPLLVPGAKPKFLELKLDNDKIKEKRKKHNKHLIQNNIDIVFETLNIVPHKEIEFLNEAKEYIYIKVVEIANTYRQYSDFKNPPKWLNDKDKLAIYINQLLEDSSHITFKLNQAINYLKYGIYRITSDNLVINLSKEIDNIIRKETERELRTIDLIPPSFLQTNVFFEHGGNLDSLSSGEKQQIYSINTIAYHLFNLKSVRQYEGIYKYNSINIVFDEVELYFHPDMQRTYINNLRERISTLKLNKDNDINNINIIFITHSPFILSDIPSQNILKLKDGNPLKHDANEQSFGANIHNLLHNDFYLKSSFMGEFAKFKINSLVKFLKEPGIPEETTSNEEKNEEWKQTDAEKFIKLIGEPIIRESLKSLFDKKFIFKKKNAIQKKIFELEQELKKISNEENTNNS